MCTVLSSHSHSSDADFARIISRKFLHGRFLIVGANSRQLERQFTEVKRDAVVMWSPSDLMVQLGQGEATARFEAGVWFYPSGDNDDDRVVKALERFVHHLALERTGRNRVHGHLGREAVRQHARHVVHGRFAGRVRVRLEHGRLQSVDRADVDDPRRIIRRSSRAQQR